MRPYKFIISGGGTGGHIYPAIAIANELKRRYPDARFLFVGAKDRMEMEKVPQAGYEIIGLWISGIQRKLSLKNLALPFKLISSILKARSIVRKFRPDAAIGTGGYASAPLLKAASGKGVPCLIQEQNSYAGITNKLLKNNAARICVAYDGMEAYFPKEKLVLTGNPVRQDIIDVSKKRDEAITHFGLSPEGKTLLVLGGSLGARKINQLVASNLEALTGEGLQLLWQCGKLYESEYRNLESESVKVLSFIQRMDLAYAAADIIVSRAGALSVSELCLVGKPVIFIPSPNVAEDHQTKNARAIAGKDAAVLMMESEADAKFTAVILDLMNSEEKKTTLSANIRQLAKPNAARDIADEIEKIIRR